MNRTWSRHDFVLCLAYYASFPLSLRRAVPKHFAEELASLTGRTVDSIELRFANFNALDPEYLALGLKGMDGGGSKCRDIWNEFSSPDGSIDAARLMRYVAASQYTHQEQNG